MPQTESGNPEVTGHDGIYVVTPNQVLQYVQEFAPVVLRYDPSAAASRGVEVWHEGVFVHRAQALDAYANCFVRRHRGATQGIEADIPAAAPRPTGLALRDLHGTDSRDKGRR